jgi:hypothetical protein
MANDSTPKMDAVTYAEELSARGYDHVYMWHFSTQTNGYPTTDIRAEYARGYAVNYSGRIRFADGTRAPHTEGVVIICDNDNMPLEKLIKAGRALIIMAGEIRPYYLASYNPRETDKQRDPSINPGTYQQANMKEITADTWGDSPDGPHTFYDFALTPAGDVPERFNYNA